MSGIAVVTGATGWLGSRLVRALVHGLPEVPEIPPPGPDTEVRCLLLPGESDKPLKSLAGSIGVHRGDLRERGALDDLFLGGEGGTLFHCAGIIHPRRRTRELFEVNVEGTRNAVEAAADHGLKRVVVISSNSPFGFNASREHRFDEESPYDPYMDYGRSKMLMEQAVAEIQDRGRIETVVVRAPWFYGPSQPARQTRFFSMIRRGVVPLVGDGENLRSMAYIDNLCHGVLLCAVHPHAAGERCWIADRRPYSMNEIVDTVYRLMASEFGLAPSGRRLHLPRLVSGLAGIADGALQKAGLYRSELHVLSEMDKNIACSIRRAERLLGYDPRIELEEGMRRSLQWCIDNAIPI